MSATSCFKVLLLSFIVAVGTSAVSAPANAGLNILLTNDDGYGSYGITAMQAALEGAGHTVYISAPAENQSGKSGAINSDYGAPVAFTEEVAGTEWSVAGTPADSVSAGLNGLPIPVDIDLVVSGINDGENVAKFTNASGTVGAAMWGLRRGTPAIAVSVGQDIATLGQISDCPGGYPDPAWYACYAPLAAQAAMNAHIGAATAAALVPQVIDAVLDDGGFHEGLGLSVNVPSGAYTPKGIRVTRSDNSQAFDLVIQSDGSGGLVVGANRNDFLAGALTGSIDCDTFPYYSFDLDSEGEAFACAYTTIAIVDGNIDASQDTTRDAKDLACSLEDLATVGIFNCGCGHENDRGKGHGHHRHN